MTPVLKLQPQPKLITCAFCSRKAIGSAQAASAQLRGRNSTDGRARTCDSRVPATHERSRVAAGFADTNATLAQTIV
ncbi:unnamed protein product [Leptosia nina]|uniref:Uncharacterized protein n=1 Tax=Leptosia nina TaxID=320188 RepID=A0AAV1JUC3_9NEOP